MIDTRLVPLGLAFASLTAFAASARAGLDDEALELHSWKERVAHARTLAHLRARRVSVTFESEPLDLVLARVSKALARPILMSPGLVEAVDSGALRPVTWRLPAVRATVLLAGLRTLTGVVFVYRARQIHALLPEEFRPDVSTRFYAVTDITFRLRDFVPRRSFDLRGSRTEVFEEETPEPRPAFGFDEEQLLELIEKTTGGRSWDEDERVSAQALRGMLVIRQTPRVHRAIDRLLRTFR